MSFARHAACGIALLLTAAGSPPAETAPAPVPVVFDTDMDTDCDDAGALAMLHALADRGEVRILATVVSSRYAWSAPCVEAINRYRGRPDLPIGVPKGEGASTRRGSRYARKIAGEFPGRLKTNDDAPDAAAVYRRVLAAEPDRSVTIVTVGYLTNLRDLLATKPDAHSPLAGPELVRRKVARWVCMGGRYPEHLDPGVYGNFKPDPAAAVAAVRGWPGTIHFSGRGSKVLTGKGLRDTPAKNPVRRVYDLYLGKKPTRPSWDQVALLFAVRPDAPHWQLRTDGYNHLFENGTNQWRAEPDKDHVLIDFAPDARERVQETIEALMVAPPAKG
jgi:hypothetical protein